MAESPVSKPPHTVARPVRNTYFSNTIIDPYQWMEDQKSPEVVAWFAEQDKYTRAYFDKLPGRAKLLERVRALSDDQVAVQLVQVWNHRWSYLKTPTGADTAKIFFRDGIGGQEKLLLDPAILDSPGKHHAIDGIYPSRDGRYVAFGASANGARDQSAIHIVDTTTRQLLPEKIERAPLASISWSHDSRSFYYMQLPKPQPGADPSQYNQRGHVYVHRLNSDTDHDTPLFGYGLSPAVQLTESDFPALYVPGVGNYVFAYATNGVQDELTVYVASVAQLNGAATPWRKLFGPEDEITSFGVRGDELYLLSHKGASRYQVLRTQVSHCDPAHASVVRAAGEAVIAGMSVAKDALYLRELDGGVGRIRRIPFGGGAAQLIDLPFSGALRSLFADEATPGVSFVAESWTHAPVLFAYDPTHGLVDTHIATPPSVDFSGVESIEVKAKGNDGVSIPLSIVYKRGIKLDGSNPTLLVAYGAYGYSLEPSFDASRLAWLERGGIYAVAHVRGGGEYGEDWHRDGMKTKKQNSIKDVITCAHYLIEHKYTSTARLAVEGRSAGAIAIGGAVVQEPALFAAAVLQVGVYDMLRLELMPLGAANVPEFGSTKTLDGFQSLLAMSSYDHVKEGTRYPAVLLTTGINDPTVPPWQTAKMVARLQAATASHRPILMRADPDVGHGSGSPKSKKIAELVDEILFLEAQLGSAALTD